MSKSDILCQKCGQPFLAQKVSTYTGKVIKQKGLRRFERHYTLCPECRRSSFASSLVGNMLKPVPGPKPLPNRRSEPMESVKSDPRTGCTVYKSGCAICNSECDALVYVKDGKVVKVEGDPSSPLTSGTLCAKGLASRQLLYHPERIRYPMKRSGERGQDRWERISWDEALDTIVHRFKELEEKYGKESIGMATGTSRGWMSYFWRFANAYGCQHIGPGLAQCALPRQTGSTLVTGGPSLECPDYPQTTCMIVWGANPPATWPNKALRMMEAKAKGAKLIVVDPVLSESAAKADIWLQLRPGTDAALALGMLNVIINEQLYDTEFVDKRCLGFGELQRRVNEYPPEKVAQITWVPRGKIESAARLYATNRPACITQVVAIEQNADTISTSRSIAMLASITGNIDVPGGNVFLMPVKVPARADAEITLHDRFSREQHAKRLGSKEYPLLAGEVARCPTAHNHTFWKAVLTGKPYPIRAIYCHGSNLIVAYANSRMVIEAIKSLDFFAVADIFFNETNRLADIVLPAATWMERNSVNQSAQVSYNSVHMQQKVTEIEDCWTDFKILSEMARRLGIGHLMFKDDFEFCNFVLKSWGISFDEFKKRGMLSVSYTYRRYEKNGFKTPSGKIELYSQKLKDLGFDPLPEYREPAESPVSTPELAKEYPLIITTGGRVPVFRHSDLRNIPWLREIVPDLLMTIHPETAGKLGIADGDAVVIESPRGSIEARAYLTEGVDPRVIQVPSHWSGKNNVNILMDNENCAPMIGSAQLRCQLCRVRKAN